MKEKIFSLLIIILAITALYFLLSDRQNNDLNFKKKLEEVDAKFENWNEVLPKLANYPDKEIENRVNLWLTNLEKNLGCFAYVELDELRSMLKKIINEDKNTDGAFSKRIDTMTEEEIKNEIIKIKGYWWKTISRISKNSDGIFSVEIYDAHFCGSYSSNRGPEFGSRNQSMTFNLETGEPVQFGNLFHDQFYLDESEKNKIFKILYDAIPKQDKERYSRSPFDCYKSSGNFALIPKVLHYSISGKNLIVSGKIEGENDGHWCPYNYVIPVSKFKDYINPEEILKNLI